MTWNPWNCESFDEKEGCKEKYPVTCKYAEECYAVVTGDIP